MEGKQWFSVHEWDRSSAWLERLPVKEKVAGPNPVGPAILDFLLVSITAWNGGTYLNGISTQEKS